MNCRGWSRRFMVLRRSGKCQRLVSREAKFGLHKLLFALDSMLRRKIHAGLWITLIVFSV